MMINNDFHYDTAHLMMQHSPYHMGYSRVERMTYIDPPLSMGNYISGSYNHLTLPTSDLV